MAKIKKCKWCGNEYLQRDSFMQYCDYACKAKYTVVRPAKNITLEVKKKNTVKVARVDDPELSRSRELITKAHLQKRWYVTCGLCYCSGKQYHLHHIIFRSEAPSNKDLHNVKNLIYLCNQCHHEIHAYKKYYRAYWIVKRQLRLYFDHIKKDHYLSLEKYLDENDTGYKAFKCKSMPTGQKI